MRIQVLIKENFKAVIQGLFSCFNEHVVFCGIFAKETGKFKGGKCAVCVEFSTHALLSSILTYLRSQIISYTSIYFMESIVLKENFIE